MSNQSPLLKTHLAAQAKLVSYSGLQLPLHFGSIITEHQAVRRSAGMFDISHLSVLELKGAQVSQSLRILLSNDVVKLEDGTGHYTCMCNERGGVVDDFLIFRINKQCYRAFLDSARLEKDLAWIKAQCDDAIDIDVLKGHATVAVQGPDAIKLSSAAFSDLGLNFSLSSLNRLASRKQDDWFISRSGYTGEDGIEVIVPSKKAEELWAALKAHSVTPAGLGARDMLRVEAGYGFYGLDIDENHTPEECGIGRLVDINDNERAFVGRELVEDHKMFGGRFLQVGLKLEGHGLLRRGSKVEHAGQGIGTITSGGFSPKRGASVGLARINKKFTGSCDVSVKDKLQLAHLTSIPFVPHGLARE